MNEGALILPGIARGNAMAASQELLTRGHLQLVPNMLVTDDVVPGTGETPPEHDDVLSIMAGTATEQLVDLAPSEDSDRVVSLPPTTLDIQEVRRLLQSHNSTTPDERTMSLLCYAWRAGSIIERPVPGELLPYIPDELAGWYMEHKKRIEGLIRAQGKVNHPDRYAIEYLREDTAEYEASPLLRNALRIRDISWSNYEGVHVELSVRLILFDAREQYQQSLRARDDI